MAAVATTVTGSWHISVRGSNGGIGSVSGIVCGGGRVCRAVGGNGSVDRSRNGSVSGSSSGGGNGIGIRRSCIGCYSAGLLAIWCEM